MARRAFTIVELLIAIGLLAVVIIAASKILGTTTQVSGLGEANANVTQEAEAVEKQLRQDLARLDLDGYLVVRCVGVRNDVNRERYGAAAPLLNPVLPANAMLRCDQVVFFMKGAEDTQLFVSGNADSTQLGMAPRAGSAPGAAAPRTPAQRGRAGGRGAAGAARPHGDHGVGTAAHRVGPDHHAGAELRAVPHLAGGGPQDR